MFDLRKTASRSVLLACVLFLAACGGNATPPPPTPDQNLIYTAAAQTVAAQITNEAKLNPSPTVTPMPPTATLEPTISLPTLPAALPTLPAAAPAATSALPGLLPTVPAAGTPVALPGFATATQARLPSADKCEWVSQSPQDGALVVVGAQFDIVWFIKNTGTTVWTKEYLARFYSANGGKFHERTSYPLRKEVKPNEVAEVVIDAVAPKTTGEAVENWVLTNTTGTNFCVFNLTIKVITADQIQPTATDE